MTRINYPPPYMWYLHDVIDGVVLERERQHELHGDQSHLPDGTGRLFSRELADSAKRICDTAAANGTLTFGHILEEEVREAMAETDPARLRVELVQVAAVVIQWCQAIDKRADT